MSSFGCEDFFSMGTTSACLNCIVLYWVYSYSATLYKISMGFTSSFPGYRTCSFQYQLNSPHAWAAYSAAAIVALVTIQTQKQSLSNQIPSHSWVERVHTQVKCLAQGHSDTPQQSRPVPKVSQFQVAGRRHSHRAMTPCRYMEYIFYLDVGH